MQMNSKYTNTIGDTYQNHNEKPNPTLLYMKHLSEILEVDLSDLMDSNINI